MMRWVLVSFGLALACNSSDNTTDAATEASGASDAAIDTADSALRCLGVGAVCASGPGFACATQFTTDDCFQKTCCILAPDGDPPYWEGGACPGFCASPDDIGCPHWYRGCTNGTLCCVLDPIDASAD